MRVTVPLRGRVDVRALHEHIEAVGLPGFTGVSVEDDIIHIEFPERTSLEAQEAVLVEAALSSYTYQPTWALVRRQRAAMLREADWRIQRAEDEGKSTKELRAYRQALRDVTNQPDENNPTWPDRPW